MTPAPGRVLRLAVLAWGLGDIALGNSAAGLAWLAAEVLGLAAVGVTSVVFADTTWYLLPFLLGVLFLVAWAGQAVFAYRRAQRAQGATPPTAARSPALTIAWLALPLLFWATGFWVVAGEAATPAAVMDRFVSGWAGADLDGVGGEQEMVREAAAAGLDRLGRLCRSGALAEDCASAPENLLRDIRVRIEMTGDGRATAVAELVRFERRPSSILGFIQATELVPVPVESILTIRLATVPVALGAVRWIIVNAETG